MRNLVSSSQKRPSSPRRGKSAARSRLVAVESLEPRVLLTIIGAHELEVAGRASDGTWWTTGFDWADGKIRQSDEVFARWNPAANWIDVLRGDFDGDGLDDVVGRDPDSGYWWASLADGTGSTTLLAGAWSNATSWSDVAVAHLPNPEVYATEGSGGGLTPSVDAYADLIGRASDGSWWAALGNGDGTFSNVSLTQWNAAADWRDVLYFDENEDGATDMVGRTKDGHWWATTSSIGSNGTLSYTSRLFATWNEAAGWRDVMYVPAFSSILIGTRNLVYYQSGAIVGRTSTGEWWAMHDESIGVPIRVGTWDEAAGWRDVQVLDNGKQVASSIVGRNSAGAWQQSQFDGSNLVTQSIGTWDETAGWRDVHTVSFETESAISNGILGRNADGVWQMLTRRFATPNTFQNAKLGTWNEAARWSDVQVGEFTREAVTYGYSYALLGPFGTPVPVLEVGILARRTGVSVLVEGAESSTLGYKITYQVPTSGFSKTFLIAAPLSPSLDSVTIKFDGHLGADRFVNRATTDGNWTDRLKVTARGRAGDDLLDSKNGIAFDELFGGPGLDVLLGDAGDTLTQ